MVIRKEDIEDAVVRPVYSGTTDDFGISEDDLPEVDEMDNGQEILESIQTRTVMEERQKIVTKSTVNKFAIVGIIVGLLIVVCGVGVIIGIPDMWKLDIDYRLGYVLAVMGAYMFCSFGMHVKQNEFQVETFTVEKEVPVEGLPYDAEKMKQRDTEIDAKVNEMADMFQKLAMLTSELEEKIVQREASGMNESNPAEQNELVAQAAASAVLAALNEERRASGEAREAEEARIAQERKQAEERARIEAFRAHLAEEQQRAAREAVRLEEERRKLEEERRSFEESARIAKAEAARREEELQRAEEAARIAEEQRLEEERRRAEEAARIAEEQRLEEERRRAEEAARIAEEQRLEEERRRAEEAARIAEEQRLEEERRRAEEAARIAEEQRLAEERRKAEEEAARIAEEQAIRAEEERLASLGLSASTYAWSSKLGRRQENVQPERKEVSAAEKTEEAVRPETISVAVPESEAGENEEFENGESGTVGTGEFRNEKAGIAGTGEAGNEKAEAAGIGETGNEEPETAETEYQAWLRENSITDIPKTEKPKAEEAAGWNFGYHPYAASQNKSIWPEIPPMYPPFADEQPQLTEEEERQLAEERAERARRIQEQLSKMYESRSNDGAPDDFSDLDDGIIIIK